MSFTIEKDAKMERTMENLKKTSEEMLYLELIHVARGARRFLHGNGPGPEGSADPCGPDCPPGRPVRRTHGHHSPVLARERILALLLEQETAPAGTGLRQKDLTEAMQINASTMSEFIGHLESDGYVERMVDPSDRRAALITLTEKGRVRACELQDARKERLDQLFSPLSEEELKELFRLLNKLQCRREPNQQPVRHESVCTSENPA